VKLRAAAAVVAVAGLAWAAVYVRRKRAADAIRPVQLGFADGAEVSLLADEPATAALKSAAGGLRVALGTEA
jgi:hypothetical protein